MRIEDGLWDENGKVVMGQLLAARKTPLNKKCFSMISGKKDTLITQTGQSEWGILSGYC
jgi:hypothetical protein